MKTVALVRHQFRFDWRRFWRDPAGIFYAVGFPLIFLFTFLTSGGADKEIGHIAGHALESTYYFLPGVLAMSVAAVTFINLAVSLTAARERGTLKRVRGTPLPAWIFLAGRIATSVVVSLVLVVLVVAVGRLRYGVAIPTATLPAVVLALVIGAAAFCCLGFALTVVTPSANTAAALAMTPTIVLCFISGVYVHIDNIPAAATRVADLFPIKHLFIALAVAFDPATKGIGIRFWDLAVLAAWGLAGLLVALRFFRWAPRP